MNRTFTNSTYLAAILALTAVACESSNGASDSTKVEPTMTTTLSALESAIGACKEQRDSCVANLSDATVDRGCKEAYAECKRGAIDGAMPDIDKNVNVCSEEARTCRAAAADEAAKATCREELQGCLGTREKEKADRDADVDESGDEAPKSDHGKPDAGAKEEHESPVASCTSALHDCIDGDQPAKVCTDALRACLHETLPNHANGQDHRADAGKADEDHGKPNDAGRPADRPVKEERDAGRGKPQI